MLPIKHILFPMDFSERSLAAAPFVEAMAKRFGSKVTMLSVVQPVTYIGMAEPGAAYYIEPAELKADLQKRLDSTLVREFAAVPVTRVTELGDPATAITAYAHNHGVDLIMMPTHGYGPFRRLLLGSVTAKVLHDAHCPVWTGAHMEEPPAQGHIAPKNVMCAVDHSATTAPLMQWAAQLSRDTGASLRLIHAVPGAEAWPERQFDSELEQVLRERSREEITKVQKTAGVEAPLCIGVGDVAGAVREEARRHNADLIVIGRGVIHEKLGRLRTHAHSIIRHAPCPVISV
jgi:nucleotide-binding universal stress UspA family protein